MMNSHPLGLGVSTHSAVAHESRLRVFAKAIGEQNPIYTDIEAARQAGHPALPLPPTFLFCLDMDGRDDAGRISRLGLSLAHCLHAEQQFRHHRMAYAGQTLNFRGRVTDLQEKKSGSLIFVSFETQVSNQAGDPVADLTTTLVERRATQIVASAPARSRPSGAQAAPSGEPLPAMELPALNRTTLGLYAGGSGDYQPIHIDVDAARRVGHPDVFAHGMLSMAWLGRLVTQWVPQQRLRALSARFTAITHIGDQIVCTGHVLERFQENGESVLRLRIQATNQHGTPTVLGEAQVCAGA